MKNSFSSLLLMGVIVLSACQSKQEHPVQPKVETNVNEVVLSETQPDEQFWLALKSYARGEYKESSDYINEGIVAMKEIANNHQANKKSIEHSISELKMLSDNIAGNRVKSIDELNGTFAKAAKSLAHLRLRVTETEFFNRSEELAGTHLQSAADHANRYISFHHYTPTKDENGLLADVKALSKRLQRGDKVSEEELKENINNIDSLLLKWETRFNP